MSGSEGTKVSAIWEGSLFYGMKEGEATRKCKIRYGGTMLEALGYTQPDEVLQPTIYCGDGNDKIAESGWPQWWISCCSE